MNGFTGEEIASKIDIRYDVPLYMIYEDGKLIKNHVTDIQNEWTNDHVAFAVGCSYSFEAALTASGLAPRHTMMSRNVPMYRTKLPLAPASVFSGGTYEYASL